jgi:hypothetical protein
MPAPALPPRALLATLLAALALGLRAAEPAAKPATTGVREIRATAPIKNFRLPTFNVAGYRESILYAAEARLPVNNRIEASEVEFISFTGDAAEGIDVMLAAPTAILFPQERRIEGIDTVRLERADLTVTGADWRYDHTTRRVMIGRDARIIFRAPLPDLLN